MRVARGGWAARRATDPLAATECNFAINTVGAYLLTEKLLPVLRASAPSRCIVVSSGGQYTEELLYEDMQWVKEGGFTGARAYARDKRRQVALTEYWAAQPENAGVSAVSASSGTHRPRALTLPPLF